MDIASIIADLKSERDRIDQALAALEGRGAGRRGRPVGSGGAPHARRARRHMSAAARKRISEMMKQRWAERKKRSKS